MTTVCVIADPLSIATHGLLSGSFGTAIRGWIIYEEIQDIVTVPLLPGWWVRRDETEQWYGPLSYRDANHQARNMTKPKYLTDAITVEYAQVGQVVGARPGDPSTLQPAMKVIYMYENGKQYLSGRVAEFNKDKVPVA